MNNQTEHTQEIKYYEINENDQRHAHDMYSYTSYVMGTCTKEYREDVDAVYAAANKVENSQREYAFQLADRYARKLAEFHNRYARIELMCPSVLICGPANFPVRKKEKQNAARDRHYKTYEYINKIAERVERLKDYKPVEVKQGTAKNEESFINEFCDVVQNEEANRIQLIFPNKPDEETRTLLKSHGFKWSPRFTAWQRQLTPNARFDTLIIIDKLRVKKNIPTEQKEEQ